MVWLTVALASFGGVLLGLALRAWRLGEHPLRLSSRVLVACSALALAADVAGGSAAVGLLAALLLIAGIIARARAPDV